MKIKGLLFGLFACAALAACTNEDIVDNNGNEIAKGEKIDTYVTLSLAASSNSSRANAGDDDGNDENSGHKNTGTANESNVNGFMVILQNGAGESADGGSYNFKLNDFELVDGIYNLKEENTIALKHTGDYKALVIVNPNDGIKSAVANASTAVEKYEAALNYKLSDDKATLADNDAAVAKFIGADSKSFMMANKKAITIKVTSANNSWETAAHPDGAIEVERAVSKITFRPSVATADMAANTYEIKGENVTYQAITVPGWYKGKNDGKWYWGTFNQANNGAYFYLFDTTGVNTGIYVAGAKGTHNAGNGNVEEIEYILAEDQNIKLIYDRDENETTSQEYTYYIQLQKYALVNLSKNQYGVRHIASSDFWETQALGEISSSFPYLLEPASSDKNSSSIFNDNGGWAQNVNPTDWFYNTLDAVKQEANNATSSTASFTYFNDLPKTVSDEDGEQTTDSAHGNLGVGAYLSYCFENSVLKAQQDKAGLVTGVIFLAQMYSDAKATTPVSVMYGYDKNYYDTKDALLDDNGELAAAGLTIHSSDAEFEAKGVTVYTGGKCYYYTSGIKHYEGSSTMESAIMRNNIYSLGVTSFSGKIGSAKVELTPSTPTADDNVYLTLSAQILPWQVRFNNITF